MFTETVLVFIWFLTITVPAYQPPGELQPDLHIKVPYFGKDAETDCNTARRLMEKAAQGYTISKCEPGSYLPEPGPKK